MTRRTNNQRSSCRPTKCCPTKIARREFCVRLIASGGAILVGSFLEACTRTAPLPTATLTQPATATQLLATAASSTPSATKGADHIPAEISPGSTKYAPTRSSTKKADIETQERSYVSLVKTNDRASGIAKAIEILDISSFGGRDILLKPNLNSADPFPGSTHPDTLRTLASELLEMGTRSFTVADRSGMGDTAKVMHDLGLFDLSNEMGFETVVLDQLQESKWVTISDSDFHWSNGFPVPKLLLDSECVVQTCNLKTHRYGGHFTMSLKNSVGLVAKGIPSSSHDYMGELHNSNFQRQMIAEINTAYRPSLIIMDAIEAFVTGGPATGKKVQPEAILAGTDQVAIDAVGVAILRLFGTTPQVERGSIFQQEQIARAVELGIGVSHPSQIEILTADLESEAYAALIKKQLQV